jgi:leucyl/phenylalanyl-tRNA--protein transferase
MRGEALTPWIVRDAYEHAAFPMAEDDGRIQFYQPYNRALFPIEGIHVSRSLRKTIRRGTFEVTFDTAFEQVMRSCLRPETEGNWISEEIIRVYTEIHFQGWAHSCECWRDDRLVGGVYGLALGSCFCAESMFHRETDASKVALWAMVEKCRLLGFTLFDAQIMNPHLASLGAYEISASEYDRLLKAALKTESKWSATMSPA